MSKVSKDMKIYSGSDLPFISLKCSDVDSNIAGLSYLLVWIPCGFDEEDIQLFVTSRVRRQ